jgi:hypothetical protein
LRAESSLALIIGSNAFSDGYSVRFFIAVLRVAELDKQYHLHASTTSSRFGKAVGKNSFVAGAEMKIKCATATIAILGGLASLAYAQRPSVICPLHGVSGGPTGAPINDKGQCEYEHSMDEGNSTHYFRASCYY